MKLITAFPYFLLLLFLVTGIYIHTDYGLAWDEDFQYRENGHAVWNFIKTGDRASYEGNPEKYHGPSFELVLVAIEKLTGVTGTRAVFFQRHLVSWIFYWLSGVALFLLLKKKFSNPLMISIGICWYFLMPRIFADAFYNTKDVPFLAITMMSLASMIYLQEHKKISIAVLHGFLCGFMIALRIMGVLIPVMTIFLLAYSYILTVSERRSVFKITVTFVLSTIIFTIAFWPILWENPIQHFIAAWHEMSNFPWTSEVLYRGNFINPGELPWHYAVTWIGITTPLPYLFFLAVAAVFIIKKLPSLRSEPAEVVMLILCIAPLLAVWMLEAVIYDGWRHLYYLYAPMCYLMVFGLVKLYDILKSVHLKRLLILIVVLCTFINGWFMFRWHPYQHMYFNALAGKDIETRYEMDYWGLSYREALEKLGKMDTVSLIKVNVANAPGIMNSWILEEPLERRFEFPLSSDSAHYFITNYRWNKKGEPSWPLIDSIVVDGIRISGTYRISNN